MLPRLIILILILLNLDLYVFNLNLDRHLEVYNRNVLPRASYLPMKEAVLNIASSKGIDKRKVLALLWCESRLDPYAVNKDSGATGLWQIMPLHGLTKEQMLDPIFSTYWAVNKIKHDGNMSAWSCSKII